MLGRGRLFQRPRASDDSDEDYTGGEIVAPKPLSSRLADKLGGSFRPRQFVVGSARSHDDFHGGQEVRKSEEKGRRRDDEGGAGDGGLSADERNRLNARLLKAEIVGNEALAKKIRLKLSGHDAEKPSTSKSTTTESRNLRKRSRSRSSDSSRSDDSVKSRDVLLTKTDYRTGLTVPVKKYGGNKDDARKSIRDMVEEERMTSADDQLAMLGDLASKSIAATKLQDDLTIDDLFAEKSVKKHKKKHREKEEKREKRKKAQQVEDYKRHQQTLSDCAYCVEAKRFHKHRVIALGLKTYLCTPKQQPLVEGHCLVVPMTHYSSLAQMDEDVFDEMKIWRKGLVAMFNSQHQDALFMETARNLHQQPHACVEAMPLPRELGDVAPVYFKKAILECEAEWADNKKLVDLSKKDIRRSIPKGFSYFSVDFGLQGGYAHAIEDGKTFPSHFGKEIVAGMLDLPHNTWRKPPDATFEQQLKFVDEMKKRWQPFDWTERVKRALGRGDEWAAEG